MRKVILFLVIMISLTACTNESNLNISKDINKCIKNELEINSLKAKTYISEYSTDSQEQDHLYGAIYNLEFVLPVECKDIVREGSNRLSEDAAVTVINFQTLPLIMLYNV